LANQDESFVNDALVVRENDEHSLAFALCLSHFFSVSVTLDFSSIGRIPVLAQGHNYKASSPSSVLTLDKKVASSGVI
jgi:hypothetical protein